MAAFSLATGLRASNVTGLQWSQVDEVRKLAWIHADQAKARRAIAVPLNGAALAIVQKRRGIHETLVFSYRGKRIRELSTASGSLHSRGRESKISVGTICGTPGRADTCRAELPSWCYRSLGVGKRPRWCVAMRTWRPITWRPMRNE
jgi:integrase